MEEKHRIAEELDIARSLKMLSTAYEEISVAKMNLLRDSVLHTRNFLAALSEVFFNVRSSYKSQLQALLAKEKDQKKVQSFMLHKTNGKHMLLLLSANDKLYGDIIPKVFSLFEEYAKKTEADLAIVGKLGKEL